MTDEAKPELPVVCHSDDSPYCYPEVTPGANAWLFSDKQTRDGTLRVTEHGLRRLLRFVRRSQDLIFHEELRRHGQAETAERLYPVTDSRLAELMNESSAMFCEGALVMSRLFVTEDGEAIRHKDDEIDQASIPGSEA